MENKLPLNSANKFDFSSQLDIANGRMRDSLSNYIFCLRHSQLVTCLEDQNTKKKRSPVKLDVTYVSLPLGDRCT